MQKERTSWGGVADWYAEHLKDQNTYHTKVVLPNLLRVLSLKKGEKVLDLACGEGFFAREFVKNGARVFGVDISAELIAKAKKQGGGLPAQAGPEYKVAPADKLAFAKTDEFDAVSCTLALQNMDSLAPVFKEVRRVLKNSGRFVFVLNHPAFRVPKRSSWGWDEKEKVQYRRVDGYLSAVKVEIDMHPGLAAQAGKKGSSKTVSYHRSLQDFIKTLVAAGFCVTKLEEWTSHRASEKGPRQRAEDTARKEIPLFMMLECKPAK